jgi:hypothetical protein
MGVDGITAPTPAVRDVGQDIKSMLAIEASQDNRLWGLDTNIRVIKSGNLAYDAVDISSDRLHNAVDEHRDVYAAARCIASEVGTTHHSMYMVTVAEAIRNEAAVWDTPQKNPNHPDGEPRRSPYFMLAGRTTGEYGWTRGWYGRQHGRWAATTRDPTMRTRAAARLALIYGSNLANGARRWFDPKTQDGGEQGGKKLNYDAIGIAEKWGSEGWEWCGPLPHCDSYIHAMLRYVGKPVSNQDLKRIVEMGRKKLPTMGPDSPDSATRNVATTGMPWWFLAGLGGLALYAYA